jgi:hypothetical protein
LTKIKHLKSQQLPLPATYQQSLTHGSLAPPWLVQAATHQQQLPTQDTRHMVQAATFDNHWDTIATHTQRKQHVEQPGRHQTPVWPRQPRRRAWLVQAAAAPQQTDGTIKGTSTVARACKTVCTSSRYKDTTTTIAMPHHNHESHIHVRMAQALTRWLPACA